LKINKLIMKSI